MSQESPMPEVSPYRLVYVTAANQEEAEHIARTLVGERLAACANVLGTIASYYWWKGDVVEDSEVSLLLKTRVDRVEALVQRVQAIHSYECPCVVTLPIQEGSADYLSWLDTQVSNAEEPR
jgi:periplasmic divalent cation tolerance protein